MDMGRISIMPAFPCEEEHDARSEKCKDGIDQRPFQCAGQKCCRENDAACEKVHAHMVMRHGVQTIVFVRVDAGERPMCGKVADNPDQCAERKDLPREMWGMGEPLKSFRSDQCAADRKEHDRSDERDPLERSFAVSGACSKPDDTGRRSEGDEVGRCVEDIAQECDTGGDLEAEELRDDSRGIPRERSGVCPKLRWCVRVHCALRRYSSLSIREEGARSIALPGMLGGRYDVLMLFTRKGDTGSTGTFHCDQRMTKSSVLAEALGTVDELNALVGYVKVASLQSGVAVEGQTFVDILGNVQQDLFVIQAELAGAEKFIHTSMVEKLERWIIAIEHELPPISSFFVSGGSELAALSDYARTVARRAERRIVAWTEEKESRYEPERSAMLPYMNRLSSLLYALARLANHRAGIVEEKPHYGGVESGSA